MSGDEPVGRDAQPDAVDSLAAQLGPDPATAVVQTLRVIGARTDGWTTADPAHSAGTVPSDDQDQGFGILAGLSTVEDDALFVSLGVDAVIDTNAMVAQQSLRDFLT